MSAIRALWAKQRGHARNTGRVLRDKSGFQVAFIACFALAFEGALWALFYHGFRYLEDFGGVGIMIAAQLFTLFFLGMFLMLTISSVVTAYSTLYRSDEIPFLLSRPFTMSELVMYKFFESVGFSSWAFFFIVVPFVGAYAQHQKLTPLFTVWTLLFSLPLLVISGGVGALLVMCVVRWFPNTRGIRLSAGALLLAATWWAWRFSRSVYNPESEVQFDVARLIPGLNLAASPLLPSWWVAEGVQSVSRGQWLRGGMLLALLNSTALTVCVAVEWLGSATYYDAWQRVSRGSGAARAAVLFAWLPRLLRPLAHDVRAMLVKDLRVFFRDPMQWSQVLIFFGLLGLYFANLRTFRLHVWSPYLRNMIAFLNVFSVSAVMCSLGSRFVYPQLSMEGQGFWVLGLSPTTMRRILLTKFLSACVGMVTVGTGLILVSCAMLDASGSARIVAVAVTVAISMAVCSFSTGLGALYLDLRQRNPAAIVSGFGGTLNLVFSLVFMLASILPFALVFHLDAAFGLSRGEMRESLLLCFVWLAAITFASVYIPLALAVRSLKLRDY